VSAGFNHSWKVTPKEAIAIQEQLRGAVVKEDGLGPIRYVAGVDVGFARNNSVTRAAVAVLSFPDLQLHEYAIALQPTSFPYVPGLLSFREAPAVLDAIEKLTARPDLLLCDGHGLAHPRRFGLACHVGLLADIPAIGVAKTLLIGRHEPVPEERGAYRWLRDKQEIVGAVLRTRTGVKPVYVSIGHRISLETAVAYVLKCTPKYRLPETTRWADRLASGKFPADL
jgi:deoxyribonuclease V